METAPVTTVTTITAPADLEADFLAILPRIEMHARFYFRHLHCPHLKADAIRAPRRRWFTSGCPAVATRGRPDRRRAPESVRVVGSAVRGEGGAGAGTARIGRTAITDPG